MMINIRSLIMIIPFIASLVVYADGFKETNFIKKNYIRLDVGYSHLLNRLSSNHDKHEIKVFLGSLGVGYIVNSHFRTDVTATYRGKYKYRSRNTSGSESQDIHSSALMINGYWHPINSYRCHRRLRKLKSFSPYLMAGIGYAINTSDNHYVTSTSRTQVLLGRKKENLAWQVGGGVLLNMSKNINLDFSYRYTDLGNTSTYGVVVGVPATVNSLGLYKPVKSHLNIHEFIMGMHIKFN